VGGLFNPSLEAVVALSPDLVVLVPSAEQRDFRRQLESLGIRVEGYGPVSFADVLTTIEALGDRVGRGEAARARVAAIRAERARVEARAGQRPRLRTVLVIQREPLFVIGRGSFVDDMMGSAGADNPGREFAEPWPRVTQEWLLAAQPELVLDASPEAAAESAPAYWARWPSLPAVRSGRVLALPDGVVTLPGPWLDVALRALDAALAGEPLPARARQAEAPPAAGAPARGAEPAKP
jgi:iron complex transport system substrate-binding protein